MDGAGTFQKIRHVTLSYLKPLILINFIGAFIGTFQATQNIIVMTMGGPENATRTLSLEIWSNAFLYLKFGYATAMAWIMGSMLIGFTLYQLRIFQRVQFTASGSATQ
jgi:multiple sugar transport system permease protein